MTLTFARVWIVISAYLVVAGWALSAIHQLNRPGYAVALGFGAVWGSVILARHPALHIRLPRRRFRRFLPLAFLILASLVVLSGFLYAPSNYDALSYRVPRTLHWLAEGRWLWIHTNFARLNTRATDSEWIMAPWLLFARSERWVWMVNAAMFAALPGLIYSMFTRAGISAKVAWHWMWVLPTGYVFLLQAGGISNDLPGAFYTLAALALALRASNGGAGLDLRLSMLAIALAAGVKASNAPLALPWLIAALPAWRLAQMRPWRTAAVACIAAIVSFLPNAILNARYCGDWSGSRLEMGEMVKAPSWVLVSGNAIALFVQNLTPPIFPLAGRWNSVAPDLFPNSYKRYLANGFEGGGIPWAATDMQIEDTAALGLGVALLLVLATGATLFGKAKPGRVVGPWLRALQWAPWIALLVFMAKVGLLNSGRLIAAYYLLLPLPILARAGQQALVRGSWWRGLAMAQIASAALVLVISPARPLWPALTALRSLAEPSPKLRSREADAYGIYSLSHPA